MLTQKSADALCTIIVAGYIKDLAANSKTAIFEYDSPNDAATYNQVKSAFQKRGIIMETGLSSPKSSFPLIIAKTNRLSNLEISQLTATTETILARELDTKVKALQLEKLYGAYIGGYSSISKIDLVGASDLELYTPTYREVLDNQVEIAFNNAKATSNKVITLLEAYHSSVAGGKKVDGITIAVPLINNPVTANYNSRQIFKSFHGMIVAMIKYESSFDQNSFIFEIACSDTTSKVSSCFPCCTFMTSQHKPPTSTHLGRGDNWNIPASCSITMRQNWERNIIKWYETGNRSIQNSDWQKFIAAYRGSNTNNELIPEIFLEALTFEKSFTKRILNTLS